MNMAIVVLVLLLNLGLSAWNAYAVGLAWVETKHAGGWPRFMAWMGAIMSASGFSWCYLLILAFIAHGLDWLNDYYLGVALKAGYVLLIPGILFSGLMITLDSWARAYRSRRILDIGAAAWNTYAQIHNTYHAIKDFDSAFGSVIDAFSGKGSKSANGKDGTALVLVFVLVLVALLSGVLTTAVIINRVAGNQRLATDADAQKEMPAGRT